MFAQTIRGKVSRPDAVRRLVDRWTYELGPTATGWLGSTSGVTDDSQLFVLVRFESEEAARANSGRPEQGEWWAEMEKLIDGNAVIEDSNDVFVETFGDLDSAGFVQITLGESRDVERAKALLTDNVDIRRAFRTEMLGTVGVTYSGGRYAMAIYYTSEAEAREREVSQFPPTFYPMFKEAMALRVGNPEYLDLKTPWLDSPSGPRSETT